jgi:antitoxin component HigA of HigAB toxin-antitoxin module
MTSRTDHSDEDDALRAAARTLHEEWETPRLWPAIDAALRQTTTAPPAPGPQHRGWSGWSGQRLAAAAALALTIGGAGWMTWRALSGPAPAVDAGATPDRFLSDEAYAEVERSEAQYTRAIDELSRVVAPKLEMPDSELLISLRERLKTIDAAIEESRMQIDRNPFNAQLRRQLLYIYQEKRQTLEQIQEHDDTAL